MTSRGHDRDGHRAGKQEGKQTGSQTSRQADRRTGKQAGKQTGRSQQLTRRESKSHERRHSPRHKFCKRFLRLAFMLRPRAQTASTDTTRGLRDKARQRSIRTHSYTKTDTNTTEKRPNQPSNRSINQPNTHKPILSLSLFRSISLPDSRTPQESHQFKLQRSRRTAITRAIKQLRLVSQSPGTRRSCLRSVLVCVGSGGQTDGEGSRIWGVRRLAREGDLGRESER